MIMREKTKSLIFTVLLTAASLILAACGSQSASVESAPAPAESTAGTVSPAPVYDVGASGLGQNTITVNSSEKVTVIPDIAEVIYAVRTTSKDAADCQQKNTEDVNKVIELLKSLGVAETSVQTSDYYMYPVYNYSNNTQKITGYEATAALTVSDLPIDNLGDILTQSVSTGVNSIQSITYSSSKYDEGYQEALKLAVHSALAKAQVLAEAGGCTLGSVTNIKENSNYSEVRYTDNALTGRMAGTNEMALESAADSLNVMPGEVDIEVNITVEYQIQ